MIRQSQLIGVVNAATCSLPKATFLSFIDLVQLVVEAVDQTAVVVLGTHGVQEARAICFRSSLLVITIKTGFNFFNLLFMLLLALVARVDDAAPFSSGSLKDIQFHEL